MNYFERATHLVTNLKQRMSPSAYDIAWLARLHTKGKNSAYRWPELQNWLLENQKPDGSWGGSILYYHDRIVCTLIAAVALSENGGKATEAAKKRAERFLWRNLHRIHRDPSELVGFELLFPTLLEEARLAGLNVPMHTYGYGKLQTQKLRLIPSDMLYSRHATTAHSLEFLGPKVSPNKLENALAENGSLGNSPAATSYYIRLCQQQGADFNPESLDYLDSVRTHQDNIIYLFPFRVFELTWVLNNFAFTKTPLPGFIPQNVFHRLENQLTPAGIGLDPLFGIPDGDCTSVALYLLKSVGIEIDPNILTQYEVPDAKIFRTYHYERNSSISTNIHVLEALNLIPEYPNSEEVKRTISVMLLENRQYNIYWTDKWHASPYYTTSHALTALMKTGNCPQTTCVHSLDWLVNSQRRDGSWGFFNRGTAEETAYVLLALQQASHYYPVKKEILQRGAAYLHEFLESETDPTYPELWLGKCLYSPYEVVTAAVLAALINYELQFGAKPA